MRHYKDDTMTNLAKECGEDGVWLAVDSSHFVTAESASKWAQKEEIPYPILLDASGEVGKTYGAKTTPHMFVVGKDGTLLYNGAIDDDPRGESKEPTNYVAAAVHASMKGEAVAQTTTKPYGCSVKYGKADAAKAAKASR
jgi:alkyl hydroperoxide reductase subunit AhpC